MTVLDKAPEGRRARKTRIASPPDDTPVSVGLDAPPEGASDASEVDFEDLMDAMRATARSLRATGVKLTVHHTPGGRLPPPLDRHYNGIGGSTLYGVSFIVDWRDTHPEPAFVSPSQKDARAVLRALQDEQEETWRQTVSREEKLPGQKTSKSDPRASDGESGDGSSRPGDSSSKPTGGSRRKTLRARPRRSRRTSSPR